MSPQLPPPAAPAVACSKSSPETLGLDWLWPGSGSGGLTSSRSMLKLHAAIFKTFRCGSNMPWHKEGCPQRTSHLPSTGGFSCVDDEEKSFPCAADKTLLWSIKNGKTQKAFFEFCGLQATHPAYLLARNCTYRCMLPLSVRALAFGLWN